MLPAQMSATSQRARRPTSRTSWARSKGVVNYGDNYGERIQGYFTAPVTGNYFFWIAGSDSAQLWISDDNQQVKRSPARLGYPDEQSHRARPKWNIVAAMEFASQPEIALARAWSPDRPITSKFAQSRRGHGRQLVGWLVARPDRH